MAQQDKEDEKNKYANTSVAAMDPKARSNLRTAATNVCSNLTEIKELAAGMLATKQQGNVDRTNTLIRHEILPAQQKVKDFFDSPSTQLAMALLIFVNFMIAAAEAQIKPLEGTPEYEIFQIADYAFNAIFTIELVFNMYSNFFFPFWANLWNIFDFAIVAVSLFSLFFVPVDVTALRLFRALRRSIVAFKVVRLLKMDNLKIIILGVLKSLPGVSNAFILLGLIMGIWSIMGVSFFREDFPEEFGNFFRGMLSMCQIMTFDSWSSGITRPVLLHDNTQSIMGGIFFITYVFASAIIMANVVLAILIDKFLSTAKEIEEQKAKEAEEEARARFGDVGMDLMSEASNPIWEFGDRINKELIELRTLMGGPLTELVQMQKSVLATTSGRAAVK
jgi:voltage-gated sodium channel